MSSRSRNSSLNGLGLGILCFIVLATVVTIVALVQRRPSQSSAVTFPDQRNIAVKGTSTFTEDFQSVTFRDAGATTANWDTMSGQVLLPVGSANYYKADRVTQGADEIDDGGANSLALDSTGNPVVTWSSLSAIFIARWNGNAWVGYAGATPDNLTGAGVGSKPKLVLDSADNPVVVWEDYAANEVMIYRWTGSTWAGYTGATPENISNTIGGSFSLSLALDSSDGPVVAWHDDTDDPNFDIFITHWTGSAWSGYGGPAPENITGSGFAFDPTVAVDSAGLPVVAWVDGSPSEILVSHWTGSAWSGYGGPAPDNVSGNAGTSEYPRIATDGSGNPVVAWDDDSPGVAEILVSHWTGSTWAGYSGSSPDNVSNTPTGYSYNVDMQVSGSGVPVVTWEDDHLGVNEIFVSRWDGSSWNGFDALERDNASNNSGWGYLPSLALDATGNPAISWEDTTPGPYKVLFSQRLTPHSSPAVAQSVSVDTTSENISSATLTPNVALNGGTVDFFLSNNGGATFFPASTVQFASTGSDLRWKAELTGNPTDLSVSPVINGLSISYSTASTQLIRIPEDDPVELAIEMSQQQFISAGSASAIVLARSNNMADAFAVAPYASLKNASLLLTPSSAIPVPVMDEIMRVLGSNASGKMIYLAGGTDALNQSIENQLTAAGLTNQLRFPGKHRRETARLIANQVMAENPVPVSKAFVSEDQAFVDTLGLGAVAGDKTDGSVNPILLVRRGETELNDSIKVFLREHSAVTELEIVGGPAAVPSGVGLLIQQAFPQITNIERSEGVDRFATNRALNEKYFSAPSQAVIANGEAFAIPGAVTVASSGGSLFSALIASKFAAGQAAPLLVTRRGELPSQTQSYLTGHSNTITKVYVVGTTEQIDQTVENLIRASM